MVGAMAIELLRDDQVEHGVPQELEPLVVLGRAGRGVGQGELEQVRIDKVVGEESHSGGVL